MTSGTGQWIGNIEGPTNEGTVTLNLDFRNNKSEGIAVVWDQNPQLVSYTLQVGLSITGDQVSGEANPYLPINTHTMQLDEWAHFHAQYPNVVVPHVIKIAGTITDKKMVVEWNSEIGTMGTASLARGDADLPSAYPTTRISWRDYKDAAMSLNEHDFIFRGQGGPWRLRTSFHRNGRFDLTHYAIFDVQQLARHFSANAHLFDTKDPLQHGALLCLAQHHGYPTPLLDWTASPFIAAFFAFADANCHNDPNVRVFALDRRSWQRDTTFSADIGSPVLNLSVHEMTPIKNDRMLPQQSITTFSNIDDIEGYIRWAEKKNARNYLTIYEIPKSERDIAMGELRRMGISHSSMFPGLDGTCRDLKERYF